MIRAMLCRARSRRDASLRFRNTFRAVVCAGLVAAVLWGCAQVPVGARSAGRVVFPTDAVNPWGATPLWSPTEVEVVACEVALGKALAKHGKNLARYNVRMIGTERRGARVIIGDACDIAMPGAEKYLTPPEDGRVLLVTFGGGNAFFSFEYDPASRKLVKFHFNAPL